MWPRAARPHVLLFNTENQPPGEPSVANPIVEHDARLTMKGIVNSRAVLWSGHAATGPTGSMLAHTPISATDMSVQLAGRRRQGWGDPRRATRGSRPHVLLFNTENQPPGEPSVAVAIVRRLAIQSVGAIVRHVRFYTFRD